MGTTGPELLERLRTGDASVFDQLTPALYQALRRIAVRHLRGERRNHTLQATALVNEAYLKLFDRANRPFHGDAHFLAIASRAMRQVLVDYARKRSTKKRGPGADANIDWTAQLEVEDDGQLDMVDLIALDTALQGLAEQDEHLARVIEMRYFGGMTAEETAEALGVSVHVVRHDVRFAQAWLRKRLKIKEPIKGEDAT